MAHRGIKSKFKPRNPQKYVGDPTKIVSRSTWEKKCMNYFDRTTNVIKWASEEVIVRYREPFTNRTRRYFPDFVIEIRQPDGSTKTVMIEVKPYKQTIQPEKQKRRTKRYLEEVYTWGINSSKWRSAQQYCNERGWEFQIWHEKNMNFT